MTGDDATRSYFGLPQSEILRNVSLGVTCVEVDEAECPVIDQSDGIVAGRAPDLATRSERRESFDGGPVELVMAILFDIGNIDISHRVVGPPWVYRDQRGACPAMQDPRRVGAGLHADLGSDRDQAEAVEHDRQ